MPSRAPSASPLQARLADSERRRWVGPPRSHAGSHSTRHRAAGDDAETHEDEVNEKTRANKRLALGVCPTQGDVTAAARRDRAVLSTAAELLLHPC